MSAFVAERGLHGWYYASDAVRHLEQHNCSKGCTVPSRASVREFGPGGDCSLLAALFTRTPIPEFTDDGEHVTCTARRPHSGVKVLSFTRPWDELILAGLKPIENRTWTTTHRGPLIVHAAKSWDPQAQILARRLGHDIDLGTAKSSPTGYRGAVTLTDVCPGISSLTCQCGPWAFDGQRHWHLTTPIRFSEPIAGAGQLGLWEPPVDVLAQLAALT